MNVSHQANDVKLHVQVYHEFSMLIVRFYSLISDVDDVFDHGKLPVKSSDTELEKLKINYYGLRKGLFSLPLKLPGTTFYKSLQVNIKKQAAFEICN